MASRPPEASDCPHARESDERQDAGDVPEGRLDRRSFMQSALAIGGAAALSSTTALYGVPDTAAAAGGRGIAERDNRQFAWGDYGNRARGTPVPPSYHLLLHVNYAGRTPSGEDRAAVETAFRDLEAAFGWDADGLLFTIGYSRAYFDQFDDPLPAGLQGGPEGLIDPAETIRETAAPHEDPGDIAADTYDAVIHLASNDARNLLAAEQALWGEDNPAVDLTETLTGIFSRPTNYPARRTGSVGHDEVTDAYEEEGLDDLADEIPEDSGLSMGFNALYGNSVPREALAAMPELRALTDHAPPGMFAQGSIQHVSKLDVDLGDWYGENSEAERRHRMFSPHHGEDEVGTAGENLGDSTALDGGWDETYVRRSGEDDLAERTVEDARSEGVVGHAQKCSRSRFDEESREIGDPADDPDESLFGDGQQLEQPMLRRDFPTVQGGTPGTHFVSLMRFNGYMHYVRQAMNGVEIDSAEFELDGEDRIHHDSVLDDVATDDGRDANGIVPFLHARRRGNYVVPPITNRALPPARAERPSLEVGDTAFYDRHVGVVLGGTGGFDPHDLEFDTVRFGPWQEVNRGGGAHPVNVEDGSPVYGEYGFDVDRSDLAADQVFLVFDKHDVFGVGLSFLLGDYYGDGNEFEMARLVGKTTPDTGRVPVFATDENPGEPLDLAAGDGTGVVTTTETGELDGVGDADRYEYAVRTDGDLVVDLEGDPGDDFDVYVTLDGRRPTESDYDERSSGESHHDVRVTGDRVGSEVGILVSSYAGSGEYTLTIEEQP